MEPWIPIILGIVSDAEWRVGKHQCFGSAPKSRASSQFQEFLEYLVRTWFGCKSWNFPLWSKHGAPRDVISWKSDDVCIDSVAIPRFLGMRFSYGIPACRHVAARDELMSCARWAGSCSVGPGLPARPHGHDPVGLVVPQWDLILTPICELYCQKESKLY